ncbi:Sodium/iodide cotransporter [Armadillidium vulgare]|nr:Sodium/iodide cotransporter [Armadillidium vulgare]
MILTKLVAFTSNSWDSLKPESTNYFQNNNIITA